MHRNTDLQNICKHFFSFLSAKHKKKKPKDTPPTYNPSVKSCPDLLSSHRIYIQTRKKKQIHLTIGGHAYLLPNTSLVIKCPVTTFPKASIQWFKDERPLTISKRVHITNSASLKIRFLGSEDIGVYKCVVGPRSDILTLQLIGNESKSIDTLSSDRPGFSLEDMLPNCGTHERWSWIGLVIVSLLPPGEQEVSLQPEVKERLINITLQADRREIKQEAASAFIASLLTHLPPDQLWIRTTNRTKTAKGKLPGMVLSTFNWNISKMP